MICYFPFFGGGFRSGSGTLSICFPHSFQSIFLTKCPTRVAEKTKKTYRFLFKVTGNDQTGVETQKIDKGRILEASGDIWKVFWKSFPGKNPKKNQEKTKQNEKKQEKCMFSVFFLCFGPRWSKYIVFDEESDLQVKDQQILEPEEKT